MESIPFTPAFPPRRAFFFFFLIINLYSSISLAGYVANYSTLQKKSTTETLVYIQNVQSLLKNSKDQRLRCRGQQNSSQVLCRSLVNRKKLSQFFERPEFYRMGWNAETLKVSAACTKRHSETCKKLLKLKGMFFKRPNKKSP